MRKVSNSVPFNIVNVWAECELYAECELQHLKQFLKILEIILVYLVVGRNLLTQLLLSMLLDQKNWIKKKSRKSVRHLLLCSVYITLKFQYQVWTEMYECFYVGDHCSLMKSSQLDRRHKLSFKNEKRKSRNLKLKSSSYEPR